MDGWKKAVIDQSRYLVTFSIHRCLILIYDAEEVVESAIVKEVLWALKIIEP